MNKVFLTEPIHENGIALLSRAAEVVQGSGTDARTIIKEAADCNAVLIRSACITKEIIESLPKLKIIAKHGIGTDNIDLEAATSKGVYVVNAPEANVNSVAEHALTMLLALSKNLVKLDEKVREGDFSSRSRLLCTEVKNKTVGLIGFGRIARLLARKIKALDMSIIAYDAYINEAGVAFAVSEGIQIVDNMDEIYARSDFISIHVPLTSETKNMIGSLEFSKMKPEAFLINAARGHIVCEEALVEALKNNVIRGAALDVFANEPPLVDDPLFSLDNIIVSPHNAALTHEAMIAMAVDSAQGIVDYFEGKMPENVVNHKEKVVQQQQS